MISNFIKGNVFPDLKFVPSKMLVGMLQLAENANPAMYWTEGILHNEFKKQNCKWKVLPAFTEVCHTLQQHSKRTYIRKLNYKCCGCELWLKQYCENIFIFTQN